MTRFTFCTLCLCTALVCSAALFAQSVNKPKITNIPGGFFVEWDSPVELAAVQLDGKLAGTLEVMFDVPSVAFLIDKIDKKAPSDNNPDMVTALAGYWMMREKPERAIPLYEASLKQGNLDEEKSVLFQNNLAMLYSRSLGQHDKALEIVENALNVKKDHVPLLDTKGLILLESGNATDAIPVLTQAVELSCQVPLYCMHLATAMQQDGRSAQSIRRWLDPVRDQLIAGAPKMTKENKAMFDNLQRLLPPVTQ